MPAAVAYSWRRWSSICRRTVVWRWRSHWSLSSAGTGRRSESHSENATASAIALGSVGHRCTRVSSRERDSDETILCSTRWTLDATESSCCSASPCIGSASPLSSGGSSSKRSVMATM
eukprot:Amastigsp_a508954_358.p6 type:complete len:118 gc:universal Amastigsp_a508954_358:815-1168(+)